MNDPHDVIIAGAGPVGLYLACELRLAGVDVLVLERAPQSTSALKELPFGLRGLSAPTIEALDRRGMLDALLASQPSRSGAHWADQTRRSAGHFAGIPVFHDKVDTARWRCRRSASAPTSLAVTMQALEAVLGTRAEVLGVPIRRDVAFEALDASAADVAIAAGGETYRSRWLVGCDGGRSLVRKAAGFAFTGTDPEFTGYSVEVELADASLLTAGRTHTGTGMYTFAPPGTIAMVDFDGGAYHRMRPVTCEHVQAVLRRVTETNVTVTALKCATTWTDRAYQASSYRRGRVLLAGDAAHIHSPLGGQGLNLGIGDAVNLGWKLAATIRGDAPEGLLDSYTSERHPIGAAILDWSRAQVALMRPTRASRALAAIVSDLIATSDGATYVAERVWGIRLRHDLGRDHPLVGTSAPEVVLTDGSRFGELMRDGRGLLLDLAPDLPLQRLAGRWSDRIRYVASAADDAVELSAMLVRPDGIVAWVAEGAPQPREAERAAQQWFGPGNDRSILNSSIFDSG